MYIFNIKYKFYFTLNVVLLAVSNLENVLSIFEWFKFVMVSK